MNLYICGAFFLLFFVVPAVGLFFAARGAEQDPNEINRDYHP